MKQIIIDGKTKKMILSKEETQNLLHPKRETLEKRDAFFKEIESTVISKDLGDGIKEVKFL